MPILLRSVFRNPNVILQFKKFATDFSVGTATNIVNDKFLNGHAKIGPGDFSMIRPPHLAHKGYSPGGVAADLLNKVITQQAIVRENAVKTRAETVAAAELDAQKNYQKRNQLYLNITSSLQASKMSSIMQQQQRQRELNVRLKSEHFERIENLQKIKDRAEARDGLNNLSPIGVARR